MRRAIASAAPPLELRQLPPEVIERIMALLPRPISPAPTPRRASSAARRAAAVERALGEHAARRGPAAALPAELPRGACTWTQELFARERVHMLASQHAQRAACDAAHSAFVDARGGLHTCGEAGPAGGGAPAVGGGAAAPAALGHPGAGAVRVPTRVPSLGSVRLRSVAAGQSHLLALCRGGALYACGENAAGQLGLGDRETRRAFAHVRALRGEHAVCIAARGAHSLASTAAGCAYGWGCNCYGQLGLGRATGARALPARVEALDGVRVAGIAAGGGHTLLLAACGAVYACGTNDAGQLGSAAGALEPQRTPRLICALAAVRAAHVSAGVSHSLVVDAAGGVYAFGGCSYNELGRPNDQRRARPAPMARVQALAGVRAVRAVCGHRSGAVLGADGSAHAFGDNRRGELGTGSRALAVHAPSRVRALAHAHVAHCALGLAHALFLTADGSAHACGERTAALGLGAEGAAGAAANAVRAPTRVAQLPPLCPVECSAGGDDHRPVPPARLA